MLHVLVELLVRDGQTDRVHKLAELIELGRLQGHGITGLDCHTPSIVPDRASIQPVEFACPGYGSGP